MRQLLTIAVSIFLVLNPDWSGVAEAQSPTPTTPIQHVVVIFDENISFDHYFGIYPTATNPPGQPRFRAVPNTPTVNGFSPGLLTNNPNLSPANGTGATNPFRLNRSQAYTADQNHSYMPEQQSFDNGLMDLFRNIRVRQAEPRFSLRRQSRRRVRSWATTMATRSPRCGSMRRTSH